MELLLALLLGTLFGFVLQRVGAADPDKIVGMLKLKDLHLMKAILVGIGSSSALLFAASFSGLLHPHFSVKEMYWGVPVGGLFLGFGWALSGYCPGTGIVAAGAKRVDALFFILGGLLGAGLFTKMYDSLQQSVLFERLLDGKATLAFTGKSVALLTVPWSPLLAILLGVVMVLIATRLPAGFRS